jgi:hypothetical protein
MSEGKAKSACPKCGGFVTFVLLSATAKGIAAECSTGHRFPLFRGVDDCAIFFQLTGPRVDRPIYTKFAQDKPNPEGTQLYGISCNEGWRESIVCTGMFGWAADWLLEVLGHQPYASDAKRRGEER